MQRRARVILLVLFWSCASFLLHAADPEHQWIFTSPTETVYDANTGLGMGTNVTVKYGGTTLTADYAQVNQNSGLAVAEGHVLLQREGDIWRGDSLQYNFKTKEVLGKNFKSGHLPFFVHGDVFIGD